MELKEIQHFLNHHIGEQFFEKDMELYKAKFPQSRLIPELNNAQKYNKAQLDERMCFELLNEGGQCIDCIWENRGFIRDSKGFIVPMQKEGELNEFEKELLAIDLDGDHKYNVFKTLVYGLQLPTIDNKGETYIAALKDKKAELLAKGTSLSPEQTKEETDAIAKADADAKAKEDADADAKAKTDADAKTDATTSIINASPNDVQLSSRGNVLVDQSPKDNDHTNSSDAEKKSEALDQNTQESTGQI